MTTSRRALALLLAAGTALALGLSGCSPAPSPTERGPAVQAAPSETTPPGTAVDGARPSPAPSGTTAIPSDDVDGAVAALERYLEAEHQVLMTGEFVTAKKLAAPDCIVCGVRVALWHEAYVSGVRTSGGRSTVDLKRRIHPDELVEPGTFDPEFFAGVYVLDVVVHTPARTHTDEGEVLRQPASSTAVVVTLQERPAGRWLVVGYEERS